MTRFNRIRFAALGLAAGGTLGFAFADSPVAAPKAHVIPAELASYRDIVKNAMPAVVKIECKATAKKLGSPQMAPQGVPEEFKKFFEGMPQQPEMEQGGSQGSGVIVDANGTILTNSHVVDGAESVTVTLHDGRTFTATDIRRDPKTDLAVVKIASDKPLPFLTLANSDDFEVGDRILAIGAPYGLSGSVTHGIISAKGRSAMHINQYEDFLQIDAAINPGNSGGPLISLDGKVVGINSAIKSRTGGFQGIGLAISSNMAKDISTQLLAHGTVKRGYLGVAIRDLDVKVAERLGVNEGGVLINKVHDNTPAAKAGLKSGDVITSLGGVKVKNASELPKAVVKMPVGTAVDATILRDGKTETIKITLEEQPADFGTEHTLKPLAPKMGDTLGFGITGTELNDANAKAFGYSNGRKGVVVAMVEPGSAAANAGLMKGVMIQKIDNVAVTTLEDAKKAFAAADKTKGALVQVTRPSGEVDYAVVK